MSAAAEASHPVPGEAPADFPVIDSRFAHALAHEIRSPLTAIQMCAETLGTSHSQDMKCRYCGIIVDQAQFIAWALDDLITLADAALWIRSEHREVDLTELAERSIHEIARLAESRGVKLDARLRNAVRPVLAWGVPSALRQLVRCCLQAMFNQSSAGDALLVSVLPQGHETLPEGMVGMTVKVQQSSANAETSEVACVPWHRIALVTAARVAGEHGGMIGDLNDGGPGIRVLLPAPGWTKGLQ
ncbi:MAG: HAMP domain-containing histidine kinase [Armatimonadetes bacterium]|nr:HAMP domain-containing histidine kinase [Armatimonadota bacterium]